MATVTVPLVFRSELTSLSIEPGGLARYVEMVGDPCEGNPRVKCSPGRLDLVSPGPAHERAGCRLGLIVMGVCASLRVPAQSFGSTLLREAEGEHGAMPDDCFYIGRLLKEERGIDLSIDPPPNLIIEVVVTHPADHALAIYEALCVPEVWVMDVPTNEFRIHKLARSGKNKGRFVPSARSLALPLVAAVEIVELLADPTFDDIAFSRNVRRWANRELRPRMRRGGRPG